MTVQDLRRDSHGQVWVEDDEVGVAPDREVPLLRIQPEDLRRLGAQPVHEVALLHPPRGHTEMPHERQERPDAGKPHRDPTEVRGALVLVGGGELAVVGRDDLDQPLVQGVPQVLLVLLAPQRRAGSVALPGGTRQLPLVQQQEVRARLGVDLQTQLERLVDGLDTLGCRDVDNVDGRSGVVRGPQHRPDGLPLDVARAARRVVGRRELSLLRQAFDLPLNDPLVLAVHLDEPAVLAGSQKRAVELLLAAPESRGRVHRVCLEGRDARLDHLGNLVVPPVLPVHQ